MFPVAPPFDVAYRNESVSNPVGPHTHNAAEIYFTLTDLPDVLINDTVSAVPAGTILIIPSFCIHQLYHKTGVSYERYLMNLNTDWLNAVFCEGKDDFSYLLNSSAPVLLYPEGEQKKELIRHFDRLISFTNRTTPEAMVAFFQFLSLIHDMVSKLAPQTELPISPSQEKVNNVIAYLYEHLHENITISDLAAHFYLNPDYLSRLFKNHVHFSIGQYVTLQKISVDEAMLREGKSVAEVQDALGYSSYAYFFRTFQKITGISPSKYRKLHKSQAIAALQPR